MARYKGKLIVLDGTDGSGKATQTKLLVARLKRERHPVATLDFPQYENNLFGSLLGQYLRGDLGKPIDPRLISVVYAADRWESKAKILGWLREGRTVILDRYVSANQIHQGSRIRSPRERREFLAWLDRLEYGVFGLPRPDLVIFLHVPAAIAMRLAKQKSTRAYLKGKKRDQMERDSRHQEQAVQASLELACRLSACAKIDCTRRGKMLSREEIHERIFKAIHPAIGKGRR